MTTKTPLEWQEEQLITQEQGWKDLVVAWTKAVAVEVLDPDCDKVLAAIDVSSDVLTPEILTERWFMSVMMSNLDRNGPVIEQQVVDQLRVLAQTNNDDFRNKLFWAFFQATDVVMNDVREAISWLDFTEYTRNPVKAFLGRDVVSEINDTLRFLEDPTKPVSKVLDWKSLEKQWWLSKALWWFGWKLWSVIKNTAVWAKDMVVDGATWVKDGVTWLFWTDIDRLNQLNERKSQIEEMVQVVKDYPLQALTEINAYAKARAKLQALKKIYEKDLVALAEDKFKRWEISDNLREQYIKDIWEILVDTEIYVNLLTDAIEWTLSLAKMSWKIANKMQLSFNKALFTMTLWLAHGASSAVLTQWLIAIGHFEELSAASVRSISSQSARVASGIVKMEQKSLDTLEAQKAQIDVTNKALEKLDSDLVALQWKISTVNSAIAWKLSQTRAINRGQRQLQ